MVAFTRDIFTIFATMSKQGKYDCHAMAQCVVKDHSLVSITERQNTRQKNIVNETSIMSIKSHKRRRNTS